MIRRGRSRFFTRRRGRTKYLWFRQQRIFTATNNDGLPAVDGEYNFLLPLFQPQILFAGTGTDADSVDREWVVRRIRFAIPWINGFTGGDNSMLTWQAMYGLSVMDEADTIAPPVPTMLTTRSSRHDWMSVGFVGDAQIIQGGPTAKDITLNGTFTAAGHKDYGVFDVKVARRLKAQEFVGINVVPVNFVGAFIPGNDMQLVRWQYQVIYSVLFKTRGPGVI